MLENISNEKVFFLDIETVPQYNGYENLPENSKKFWDHKAEFIKTKDLDQSPEEIYQRAGIYAEFGKIICISVGLFSFKNGKLQFRVKSFYGDDEKEILQSFNQLMSTYFNIKSNYLCAHNGKEFDFPYISRRLIINGLTLPEALDIQGKKPWETEHLLDTMHLWRFGDYKSYTGLNLLCNIMDIPTPKDDIEGKDVWQVYWKEKNIKRIVNYCEKDVVAIARLFQRFKGIALLKEEDIEIIDS
ncbi:MAG: 3'-5' exonuclease [Bacteroidetes bacterium]|jgi:3'-5' exonuclease|nr:3'-5' exonuclease [Bacteroidota bacterium]MBT5527776.1 3'-5' exonuclease [Cytophagia bacterium]MBT3422416.1 3'-5' exonuclease [Bacteroidota bacterium]MBT3802366.1 3'-5' exonuclease [Bacteroidota bacterium]MBT3935607.1 3'-5' exonuclease [Bacteroidota bacterium]